MTQRVGVERIEQVVRKIIPIVPPENGWWGVSVCDRILLHQTEESAVDDREKYVEWLTSILRRELAKERGRVRRMASNGKTSLNPTIAAENWGKGYIAAMDYILAALRGRKG